MECRGTHPADRSATDSDRDMVTVIRLVPIGRGEQADVGSAIVANVGEAGMRREGNSIFLIVGDEMPLGHLKAGDIVRWAAEPLRVVRLAEQRAGDVGVTA